MIGIKSDENTNADRNFLSKNFLSTIALNDEPSTILQYITIKSDIHQYGSWRNIVILYSLRHFSCRTDTEVESFDHRPLSHKTRSPA